MSTKIWKQAYQQTDKLTKAALIKNVLSESEIQSLHTQLAEVWKVFCSYKEAGKGLKVFIDQKLNQKAMHKMVDEPPLLNEGLENWMLRLFEDQRFGAVLNTLEEYSNAFSANMAQIVKPLLQVSGLPAQGLSWLAFMGNYGYTPFGVHRENKGEEGFLFHIGPAKKTFHIWDLDDYNRITNGSAVSPLNDELLAASKSYELHPGDVFFIPHHTYHIGNTEKFSVSVVMDFINPSVQSFITTLFEKKTSFSSDQFIAPLTPTPNSENFNRIAHFVTQDSSFKAIVEDEITRLRSNEGVKQASLNTKKDLSLDPDKKLKIVKPFSLILKESNESEFDFLYARGHRQSISKNDKLPQLIEEWNAKGEISYSHLLESLSPQWNTMDCMQFVMSLLAIEIIRQ